MGAALTGKGLGTERQLGKAATVGMPLVERQAGKEVMLKGPGLEVCGRVPVRGRQV